MNKPIINTVVDFINSQSRNKVIFHTQDISDIETLNIGLRVSESIYNFKESSRIVMRVSSELNDLLNASISYHDVFGRYLSIENLGILFEPELKHDFTRMLDSYSQNNLLFVKWDGELDSENIYFLTKENGIKVSVKNLSHIAI